MATKSVQEKVENKTQSSQIINCVQSGLISIKNEIFAMLLYCMISATPLNDDFFNGGRFRYDKSFFFVYLEYNRHFVETKQ